MKIAHRIRLAVALGAFWLLSLATPARGGSIDYPATVSVATSLGTRTFDCPGAYSGEIAYGQQPGGAIQYDLSLTASTFRLDIHGRQPTGSQGSAAHVGAVVMTFVTYVPWRVGANAWAGYIGPVAMCDAGICKLVQGDDIDTGQVLIDLQASYRSDSFSSVVTIPPGTYTIMVRGCASKGACWMSEGISGGVLTGEMMAPDVDSDGVADAMDNCPAIYNPPQADCNNDGLGDACEIAAGSPDFNQDTIPDTCQCIADIVLADHQVNGADLGALLAQWGPATANTLSDLNRDGQVSGADLGILLNAWGPCPN
jgi:hypothetical protein